MSKKEGEIIFPLKPTGPPKVWKTIEIKKKDTDVPIKFSIQEIPEDRFEDVIDHMCKYFLADEPMSNSLSKSFFFFFFSRIFLIEAQFWNKKLYDNMIKIDYDHVFT